MTLEYKHLVGLQFDVERQNCYTLLRNLYRGNYGIELTDFPCPTDWWASDLNLYWRLAESEGFDPIHVPTHEWRPGDVILMAINSSSGNHVAVVLDNNNILHHLVGQLSCETRYGGLFRNTTVGVYRHREVARLPRTEHLVDIREHLPLHVRRKLEALERHQHEAAGEAPTGS